MMAALPPVPRGGYPWLMFHCRDLLLPDPGSTAALGHALARELRPGDTVLLSGPLGAGKSHLARAALRPLLRWPEDIPSPTFTIVQSYQTALGEVIHADLYRLTDPRDLDEIGLTDALGQAVCLIEWPELLDGSAPAESLHITLALEPGDGRTVRLHGAAARWGAFLQGLDP